MSDMLKYVTVLEDMVSTCTRIFETRDIPGAFLGKVQRLLDDIKVARVPLAKEIDGFRKANPTEARHGEPG